MFEIDKQKAFIKTEIIINLYNIIKDMTLKRISCKISLKILKKCIKTGNY